jgi:Haem degrading protein HbpS-like
VAPSKYRAKFSRCRPLAVSDFGINPSNHSRVVILAGGVPLTVGGKIVGAVGGSGEQDQGVAMAAAAVCKLKKMSQSPMARRGRARARRFLFLSLPVSLASRLQQKKT